MTQLIDKLVDLKIVERKADVTDRRIVNISLTDYGNSLMEENKQRIINDIRETISCLSDEDLEDLIYPLSTLNDNLSNLSCQSCRISH